MLQFHVDECNRSDISGWAFDDAQPQVKLEIDVRIDGESVATVRAGSMRSDLREAGKGDGAIAFRASIPPRSRGSGRIIELFRVDSRERFFSKSLLENRILVIGKAKTGTTIISKTIQAALGENTCFVMEPKHLAPFQDPAQGRKWRQHGVVAKILFEQWNGREHLRDAIVCSELPNVFDKVVAIIRDPRDELISRMMYWTFPLIMTHGKSEAQALAWIEELRKKERDPDSISLKKLLAVQAECFDLSKSSAVQTTTEVGHHYADFLDRHKDKIHILRYEDFIGSKRQDLEQYLGLPLTQDAELGHLSYTKRSGASGGWRELALPSDISWLQSALSPLMTRLGYENDWVLTPRAKLKSRYYTSYVESLIQRGLDSRAQRAQSQSRPQRLPRAEIDASTVEITVPVPPPEIAVSGGPHYYRVGQRFVNIFRQTCGLSPRSHLLEIGCGTGRVAGALTTFLDELGRYEGLDVVPGSVEWCQKEIASRFPNFTFQCADVYNGFYNPKSHTQARDYVFPFEQSSFDFVYLTSVFTHMFPEDIENYLRQIERVLKPNGRVLMTFFILTNESRRLIEAGKSRPNRTFPIQEGVCWVQDGDSPETAVAYSEAFVLETCRSANLIPSALAYGKWCGRDFSPLGTEQDIIIAQKDAFSLP